VGILGVLVGVLGVRCGFGLWFMLIVVLVVGCGIWAYLVCLSVVLDLLVGLVWWYFDVVWCCFDVGFVGLVLYLGGFVVIWFACVRF